MKEEVKRIVDTKRVSTPLKTYLWYVELPSDIPNFNGDVFEINSRIASINTPYPTVEADKETDRNSFWYYAKSIDIGSITLELYEHDDGQSFDYFRAWQEMIANQNGTFNPPIYYKRNISFYRLDEAKNKLIVDVYKGYFVNGVSDVTNDYETNGLVKFAVTLTGDSVEHVNKNNRLDSTSKEYSKFSQIIDRAVGATEFIKKVQEARVSKKSIVELLL